jgi:uncharacterized membrane protein
MRSRIHWYPIVLTACAVAASIISYDKLPSRVPIHWNIRGEVDGWASPLAGAALMPLLMLALTLATSFLPRIDPRRTNYDKFFPTYYFAMNAALTAFFVTHCAVLAAMLGYAVPLDRVAPVAFTALFIVLGNVLPRVRSNFWLGIRTPWTLSSDRVWERSHRVGGRFVTGAGILMLATLFLPSTPNTTALVPALALLAALACIIYSYVAWRQEKSS